MTAQLNVVEVVVTRVTDVATTILDETPWSWEVECETQGCRHYMAVPKVTWHPVDPRSYEPDAPQIERRYDAPGKRLCSSCGFARMNPGVFEDGTSHDWELVFNARSVAVNERGAHLDVRVVRDRGAYVVSVWGWKRASYKTEANAVRRALKELAS